MIRALTVVVALTLLLSSPPSISAMELDLEAPGQNSWVTSWFDELVDAVRRLFSLEAGEPASPVESATSGLGGPTGPCIDPQGGMLDTACR